MAQGMDRVATAARVGGCSDVGSGSEQGLRCRARQVDIGWCGCGGSNGSGRLGKTRARGHCGSGGEGEEK